MHPSFPAVCRVPLGAGAGGSRTQSVWRSRESSAAVGGVSKTDPGVCASGAGDGNCGGLFGNGEIEEVSKSAAGQPDQIPCRLKYD